MDHSTPPNPGDVASGPNAPPPPFSASPYSDGPATPSAGTAAPAPTPAAAPSSPLPGSGRRWWQRKILTYPISVWMLAALTFFVVLGVLSLLQNRGQPGVEGTSQETAQEETIANGADQPAEAVAGVGSVPSTPTIDGCTPASEEQVAAVNAGLRPGLVLGLAYTATDDAGRSIVGGSLFQAADAERISASDIWTMDGQVVYAVNSSASAFSDFSSAAQLPDSPSAIDAPYAAIRDNCLVPAMTQSVGS